MLYYSFYLLDGFAFWATLGVLGLITTVAIEKENPGWCSIFLILTLIVLQICTDIKPITLAVHNPLLAGGYVVGYFIIGTAWLSVKWRSYVGQVGREFDDIKDDLIRRISNEADSTAYFKQGLNGPMSALGKDRLLVVAARELSVVKLPLQVSYYKSTLYIWWTRWPLSATWTLINNPVRRAFWFVYNRIAARFQEVANRGITIN